jgi:hypothetical protein
MRIRDALESDRDAIAAATDRPQSVVVDTIHDRSVRVAVVEPDGELSGDGVTSTSSERDGGGDEVIGFIAFDARGDTVHVSDFAGDDAVVSRLLDAPHRFASREKMALEVVVPIDDDREMLSEIGFETVGSGPRFGGRETTRYRIEADDLDVKYDPA